MKSYITKFTYLLLVLVICIVTLSGCINNIYHDSLDEYLEKISKYGNGYSSVGIDQPADFLPSKTFFEDFEYIDGEYRYYQSDELGELFPGSKPDICLLYLQYESDIYVDAKECMQKNIKSANGKIYEYNGYCFYINANFNADLEGHRFPKYFTAGMLVFYHFSFPLSLQGDFHSKQIPCVKM